MPELPEVETVRRALVPWLQGARILAAHTHRPDLRFPFPPDFAARLRGQRVEAVGRRGKYLLIGLDGGETWLAHLGMTGRFTVGAAMPGQFVRDIDRDAHCHMELAVEGGPAGPAQIGFIDPRRFGFMDLIPTAGLREASHLAQMGPEPLAEDIGPEALAEVLAAGFAGRRSAVKVALLDQAVVAGIGNIYASEALHRARVSPRRMAGTLGPRRLARLAEAVQSVLADAIHAGGSTLRDFAGPDGGGGYFQHRFAVYDRAGDPCARCAGTIAKLVQGGRATYYCGGCQT